MVLPWSQPRYRDHLGRPRVRWVLHAIVWLTRYGRSLGGKPTPLDFNAYRTDPGLRKTSVSAVPERITCPETSTSLRLKSTCPLSG